MKNFKIDARQIKSAMTMQAKNDIRYYLNGILIGDGKVVATDGHRLIVVNSDVAIEPTIFSIKGKLPKSAINCEFVFIGDDHGVVTSTNGKGQELDSVVKFVIVEGRYPDYKRVMPNGEGDSITKIGFNVGYIQDVNNASIALGNKMNIGEFRFFKDKVSIKISTPENSAECIIMAARI